MSNTAYPGAIDSPTNPSTNDTLATVPHHTQHGLVNDAVVAIETKLGTGSSGQTPSNGAYLVGNGSGATQWVTTLTSPSITTSLLDLNSKTWIGQSAAGASAVNYPLLGNSTTGNAVTYGAAGTDSNINTNIVPKGSGKVQDNGSNLIDFRSSFSNFVQTGGVWTQNSGLVGSMTAATIWINGVEYSVAAVSNHTFGASVDTYIDYTVGTGIVYTAVSNNAASPSLAANSVRLAIAVSGGASLSSFNQGSLSATAPTVSGSVLMVSDSLGNLIYPVVPNQNLIGYRQITANTSGFTTIADITGLSVPVNVPAGRNIEVSALGHYNTTVSNDTMAFVIREGSTSLQDDTEGTIGTSPNFGFRVAQPLSPSAGVHTYKLSAQRLFGSGTDIIVASSTQPAYIKVNLV